MEISFTEEAKKCLEEISEKHSKKVLEKITQLKKNGFDNEDLKLIRTEDHGEIWRLKVKDGNKGGLDYRVFIDYIDSGFLILSILHRDNAYEN